MIFILPWQQYPKKIRSDYPPSQQPPFWKCIYVLLGKVTPAGPVDCFCLSWRVGRVRDFTRVSSCSLPPVLCNSAFAIMAQGGLEHIGQGRLDKGSSICADTGKPSSLLGKDFPGAACWGSGVPTSL